MKKTIAIIFAILMTGQLAYSHGEDKLGPNNGYIKMPAGFHTEVVPNKDGTFKVFLLDMSFKNPTVKESSVIARIENKKDKVNVKCEPMRDHFHCFPKNVDLKNGSLIILAQRSLAKGNEAIYKLPLALTKTNSTDSMEDHSGH
jgi:hypothetical protein